VTRYALAAAAGVLLAVAAGAPASAHGDAAPDASDYRVAVTDVPAELTGVAVRVIEAGERLELTNRGDRPVEVLGYAGEPYLEIRPDGAYRNVHSPGDPALPPRWQRTAAEPVVRWHDERTQWTDDALPAQAVADPGRTHRLRDWAVPLRRGVTAYQLRGTLDWVPPPQPGGWWAGALLLSAATAGLTHLAGARRRLVVAPLALAAGFTTVGYAAARTVDAGAAGPGGVLLGLLGPGLWPTLSGLAAAGVGAALLLRRRANDFVVALVAACLTLFGGLTTSAAFGAGVLPAPGPAWWWRTTVVLAVGIGAGLTAAAVLRLRVAPAPADTPLSESTPTQA
jgi:hypothetical protein